MDINKIYQDIKAVCQQQDDQTPDKQNLILKRALKLNEEAGEFSAEVLKLSGFKSHNDTKTCLEYNLKQEAVDVFITSVDCLHASGISEDELAHLVSEKLAKWKMNHLKEK
jgi:NTP pyrophosphatase (non-canonical NTP hydrolase)